MIENYSNIKFISLLLHPQLEKVGAYLGAFDITVTSLTWLFKYHYLFICCGLLNHVIKSFVVIRCTNSGDVIPGFTPLFSDMFRIYQNDLGRTKFYFDILVILLHILVAACYSVFFKSFCFFFYQSFYYNLVVIKDQ